MRYGVIGAGILGLTAGLRLAQRGHEVVVLERGTVPGGLAASFEIEQGIWLERFYHHLFRSDRSAIGLIEEVGLADRLTWSRPETTLTVDGTPHRLDSPRSLLGFAPLAWKDRLRLAATLAFLKALPSPAVLASSTAAGWMRSVAGAGSATLIWDPLLRGKFGHAADDVSMAWLWARLHDRTPELGYVAGGFHQVYLALADHLTASGGQIQYGADVVSIDGIDGGVTVTTSAADGGMTQRFDRVVATVPTPLLARLAPGLGGAYLAKYPSPASLDAQCLILALDRPLTGTYWIGIGEAGQPFLAVVEHTAMLSPDAYRGRHLLYLGAYRHRDDPLNVLPADELIEVATPLLRSLAPDFAPAWVRERWVFHAPFAQPIVDRDFPSSIPGFDTPVIGLYVASMYQVYPHDRGQNYSIELAERLVRHLDKS